MRHLPGLKLHMSTFELSLHDSFDQSGSQEGCGPKTFPFFYFSQNPKNVHKEGTVLVVSLH